LPHGAYAVIGSEMSNDQVDLINRVLDQLKESGLTIFDKRDVDRQRYEQALGKWHEDVLDQARSIVRGLIAKKKKAAKADPSSSGVIDDELKISSASSEQDLREALKFLDRDDSQGTEAVFEEARQRVPMPEVPKSLLLEMTEDSIEDIGQPKGKLRPIDRRKFADFS
jgi:hypothetical protein